MARRPLAVIGLALAIVSTACGGDGTATPSPTAAASASASVSVSPSPTVDTSPIAVTLQLPWTTGAQFAGYLAAVEQGYYDAAGLDVTIVDGGPGVTAHLLGSEADGPEFTVSWLPGVLAARDGGASDLVNIAQVFQRSGTLSLSWKGSGITGPSDFLGKRVGIRAFGEGSEVIAAARKAGLDPVEDFKTVVQGIDMSTLLTRQVDVAQALLYDGYAEILEATDPKTGSPYRLDDLDVINYNDEGTAMLQDGIYARHSWLADEAHRAIATKFLRASFEGWIHCRDRPDDCVQAVLAAGATAGAGHQAWAMNEVNALIWPSPDGIGVLDPAAWRQTGEVALEAALISVGPSEAGYRTDLATAAIAALSGADTMGLAFQPGSVEITPGGE